MFKLKSLAGLSVLALAQCAAAHGNHEQAGPADGETMQQYAQRHMSSEHHIDSFDAASFFLLHDLNRDEYWDRSEIEAVYGVHHVYSQKLSKDDIEHQKKADQIVDSVLKIYDLNNDGVVESAEFVQVGLEALPNFDNLGAEGHHYDVESEFFLHHEEKYHSTPETQTDESYTHPEDIEHFAHHEHIEHDEAEREAAYSGLTVEEVLKQIADNLPDAVPQKQEPNGQVRGDPDVNNPVVKPTPEKPKFIRTQPPPKEAPKPAGEEWGTGNKGYKPPTEPGERLRKNVPYKYKFRRNWGDF